jgi:hypothetical protein
VEEDEQLLTSRHFNHYILSDGSLSNFFDFAKQSAYALSPALSGNKY